MFNFPASRCRICGRRLTAPASVGAGIGPVCACKGGAETAGADDREFSDYTLFEPLENGIILRRDEIGAWTNVPHLVMDHSPSGFEWGYAGSGPADLALNIVQAVLNTIGYQGELTECYQGSCFRFAYRIHQVFKVEFIAGVPQEGITLPWVMVVEWVQARIAEAAAENQAAL